jgi:hypothetical protein
MIREERQITVSEVAAHLDIGYGSAYAITVIVICKIADSYFY